MLSSFIMKALMMSALLTLCFFFGSYVERQKALKPVDHVTCSTDDVLSERQWRVDLKVPLFDQDCSQHDSFPSKILCERLVTIECDLP
jgi:hypothetical protein